MCIFSQSVTHVGGTKIFARRRADEQLLAYEMSFSAASDLAMVLPLPVAPGLGEAAASFIDLSGYTAFFQDLSALFPSAASFAVSAGIGGSPQPAALIVHQVGAFEASYVPALHDFGRLDPRFRVPSAVWDRLPAYRDFGFAVFKLRGPRAGFLQRIGLLKRPAEPPQKVHPMAIAFRSRNAGDLFFPTVHVHDGWVHEEAMFDHQLYCQLDRQPAASHGIWERAEFLPGPQAVARSVELLDATRGVFRLSLLGPQQNRDVIV